MTTNPIKYIGLILVIFLYTWSESSALAQDYSIGNPAELFSSHEVIELNLKGDYKTLFKDIGDDREEHPFKLEYGNNGDTIVLDVAIATRGNFRRKAENCNFPPLKFNFKKKQVKNTLFEGINKIKLVTHCKSKSGKYEEYTLKEYLIYRVYNIITDTSLRVRLALINYLDTVSGKKTQQSYGFFIESDGAFEDRIEAIETKQKYFLQDKTRYDHIGKLAIFQYMVGNTDWAVSTLHNIKLFITDTLQPPYAIPYDFDWCGAVNAFYAKPLPRFELETVQERLYRGYCRDMAEYLQYAAYFIEKKDEIYSMVENFDLLDHKDTKRLIKYFDDFYTVISSETAIRFEFMNSCLKEN